MNNLDDNTKFNAYKYNNWSLAVIYLNEKQVFCFCFYILLALFSFLLGSFVITFNKKYESFLKKTCKDHEFSKIDALQALLTTKQCLKIAIPFYLTTSLLPILIRTYF